MKTPSYNKPCPCGSGFKYKHCCLRFDKTFSSDYIDNGYFIKINRTIIPKGMSKRDTQIMVNRLQMAITPYIFQSIGFLHSARTNTQMFGILSVYKVEPSSIPDVLFELHGDPIEVDARVRDEMFEYYLPHVHSGIPNGGIYIDGTYYKVYFLTLKQAHECLRAIKNDVRYTMSRETLADIAAYQDALIKKSIETYELMDTYKEHMRNLFDQFKDAVQESEIRNLCNAKETEAERRYKAERALRDRENTSFERLSADAAKRLESEFANLLPSVLRSISRAEADREIKKEDLNAADDVVFNYVRAVEAQLRENLREQLNTTEPSLKEMIRLIDDKVLRAKLPAQHVGKLYELANYRNPVSHGKESDWRAVDRIRSILFDEKLLYYLNSWASLK